MRESKFESLGEQLYVKKKKNVIYGPIWFKNSGKEKKRGKKNKIFRKLNLYI